MKTSTKLNIYASIAAGVAMPAIMLYELLPGASFTMSLWFVVKSVGAWIAVAILIFGINYIFFGTLFVLGRWIWDSFYRNTAR